MKGVLFTLDAMFALMIIVAVIPLFVIISMSTVSPEALHERLHLQAEDAISLMSELRVVDVIREPVIMNYYRNGVLDADDMDNRIIDIIGMLWSSNNTNYTEAARNITEALLGDLMNDNINWRLKIDDEVIYNKSGDVTRTATISKKILSGYMKGKPMNGYISKAYLNRINGKRTSSYSFFGGFVGEGNITMIVNDIPKNSTISYIYMEMNVGNNFTLFMNNISCGNFIKTPGRISVDNWTVTDPACLNAIKKGENNTLLISFGGSNLSNKFIGGGYIKIVYDTTDMVIFDTGVERQYMPGIVGAINLFSSFYSPGTLNSINAYLHYMSSIDNATIFFNIGNVTIYESNITGTNNVSINNANISSALNSSGIGYDFLGNNTVPLRIGTKTSVSGGQGTADVILITDVSGSMKYRLDRDLETGTNRNCEDSELYNSDTKRMSLANCLDDEFIDIILSNSENRVGLVSYDGNPANVETFNSAMIKASHSLSNDKTSLKNQVSIYSPGGATGVCGALIEARKILETQSTPERKKFIVLMTDGLANVQCKPPENNTIGCIPSTCPTQTFCPGGGCVYQVAERPGGHSKPYITFFNNAWIMVAGESGGTFKGYVWMNNTWVVNSSLVSGLGDVGSEAAPSMAFNITGDGRWNLIAGISDGTFRGFYWDGNQWVSNSSLASGLGDVGSEAAPAMAFNITGDGRWNLIAGENSGTFNGFYWNGNQWVSNPSLASGLGDVGSQSSPAIAFNITGDEKWNIIAGSTFGLFYGFHWDGNQWVYNSTVVNELGDAGGQSAPTLAYNLLENNWYLVTGLSTGWFYSYYWNGNTWLTICGDFVSMKALEDSISYACEAYERTDARIYAVGFGPIAYCKLAEATLKSIADCGNGTYFASSNASELKDIYKSIAQGIVAMSYQDQTMIVEGGGENNTLYPDSYVEVNYTKDYKAPDYKEISINIDTDTFGGCNGSFFIPSQLSKIDNVKLTSFSGDYWTHIASVNSSLTGGVWKTVYNLSEYGSVYTELGDPYIVHIPENLIGSNETNSVISALATGPANTSYNCSLNNRVIYTAKLRASTFYSDVFSDAWGSNVRVYFDKNYDGNQDGYIDLEIGKDLPYFNATLKTVDELDIDNNAVDYVFMKLLEYLNFFTVPGNTGRAGSINNPIDIELSESMTIETLSVGGIPYLWGPIDMGIEVWV